MSENNKGNLKDTAKELLERRYSGNNGTQVINCGAHQHTELTNRPNDCRLCSADVKNQLGAALKTNQFLNQWKDDAAVVLKEVAK